MTRVGGWSDERGATLADLLVSITLLAIISSLLLGAVIAIFRAQSYNVQDSESLGALRTAIDRLEKEVRQARKMYDDSTAQKVHVWVDFDRDNQQDLAERIVWEIRDIGSGRAELTRTTDDVGAAGATVVARSLVFDAATSNFAYSNSNLEEIVNVEDATVIELTLVARAEGTLADQRTVTTQVRLRNAQA